MKVFENSKWIWLATGECADQYVDFCDRVTYRRGAAIMRLSCDNDYTLYINGRYVASNQYGDFEHYKIYDELDIADFLQVGENDVRVLVYHCGVDTQRYIPAKAGLIYEILCEGEAPVCSREAVLSRQDPAYASGRQVLITGQLGFSFYYDATKCTDGGYAPSVAVDKQCTFYPRPIKKAAVHDRRPMQGVTRLNGGKRWRVDLGGEAVGLPTLEVISPVAQELTVSWGEHLEDGEVRRIIGKRDFSYVYKATEGLNRFTDYMLRLGCRYLEIASDEPIELLYLGVLPQVYEVKAVDCEIETDLDRRIYDACVNTLKLCMMEHYVDCPWREQAFYTCDSRNQILCGYDAFKGGNVEYVRANLRLVGMDRREDGHLAICFPCGSPLSIPSFSLYYPIAMNDYLQKTGDDSLAREMLSRMQEILEAMRRNMKNGLVCTFEGENMWNFYDWSKYSQEKLRIEKVSPPDLAINCLFVWALDCFERMCRATNEVFPYEGLAEEIRARARAFFGTPNGIFTMHAGAEEYTTLANVLAIHSGVATAAQASVICEAIVAGKTEPCTLSMKMLEYTALLQTDEKKYRDFVLEQIRENYAHMLNSGSDTVWETLNGASDFKNAGSLCHGWSAVPVYIYHRLGIAVPTESTRDAAL